MFGIPAAELAPRLGAGELVAWTAFERLYGPLLVGERLDHAAALIAAVVVNTTFPKARARVSDFVQRWDPRPVPGADELDDVLAAGRRARGDG